MTVSVDPASSGPLRRVGAERFLAWVAAVDVLLPNAAEARALTGEEDPERAALALARRTGGEAVVTCGAGGAVWSGGGEPARAPAAAAPVVDSTGAGDAFAAGWIAARLRGAPVPAALAAANASGARAVAQPGARPPADHAAPRQPPRRPG
jgi:sugar/nucleoside kinase (ribokinase family)